MLCDTGDMNALHQVIPLLSDEMHGVRSAAVQAVGTIIGKPFLMPNTQPTWLQTQVRVQQFC
jgi:HEAT repeat protein